MTATNESPRLLSAIINDGSIRLHWSDGSRQDVRATCLRHSPGFPGGERPAGPGGRFPAAPVGFAPCRASVDANGDLCLEWQPGDLRSLHDAAWLRWQHEKRRSRGVSPPGQVTWDAHSISGLPEPDFASLENDETARLALFEQVLNWGVARIRDVPRVSASVETVANWFGQTQPNPYADDASRPHLASIRVDPETPVATRQCHFLGPHTDTCWRQTLIGLLLMHCLEAHPEGGRSLLVDGFRVAERLRAEAGEAFDLLSSVPIVFDAVVSDDDQWQGQGRVISLSADGVVEGIRYNGNSIAQLDLPDALIDPVYAALENFEAVLFDRDLWWRPKLVSGDLLVIDNHRVLHGREAFDPAVGDRHLQCCNVERDDFYNRYRRLARRAGVPGWNRRLSAGVI